MAISYIRATSENLDMGRIVIQCTQEGRPFGPLMICLDRKKQIKNSSSIQCYYHTNNLQPGSNLIEIKVFEISHLARVIDHNTRRKLNQNEKF